MQKNPTRSAPSRQPAAASRPSAAKEGKSESHGGLSPAAVREIIESIVIAFVLAFLFRTFEAEAFVIPTGSMATTLMGRHKDLACVACGYRYHVSASDEVNQATGKVNGREVISATCPMCRFTMDVGLGNPQNETYRSYKGDRILVGKLPYQFGEPDRWDVAVFKYPGAAKTNFIKRIVGLPGETIRIHDGDLFLVNESRETIARKSPAKVRATLQPVHDNDYVLPENARRVWPPRWSNLAAGFNKSDQWQSTADQKSFRIDGTSSETVWLKYEHRAPDYDDWRRLLDGSWNSSETIQPRLIGDFSAYNSGVSMASWVDYSSPGQPAGDLPSLGMPPANVEQHWVGDLALECEVEVLKPGGELLFELIEGGRSFLCRIDVGSGKATLTADGSEAVDVQTSLRGTGGHQIMFANVDDQLVLEVDGRAATLAYESPRKTTPGQSDLQPVRIGSNRANLEVRHLKLSRDIFYIAHRNSRGGVYSEQIANASQVEFQLGEGQYLALGDNSAASKDSRMWEYDSEYPGTEFYVSRDLLIGKALMIYWPHSLDQIPGTEIPVRFFPNFWRMGLVR
jgi:signal peptidase I